MIFFRINNLEFFSKASISILEACKNVGITLPRFCYHELLSISGNCRMCLVEIENQEKPVASCVTEIDSNMCIGVDSPFVKKARQNVLESLLLNHPLDCPICDQAGECDLQDQAKEFGNSHSRFFYSKQTVEDKYCGPLIKTIMTRCISCTRCVRFADEIAGINFFGTLNRGVNTEIGSYVIKLFDSEISGNVIDLCPVGALTSKPYAFKSRPWELKVSDSIDVTDSIGSNIYVNYKENNIIRILPKSNSEINDIIISDKARFCYDGNTYSRIGTVYVKNTVDNSYTVSTWKDLFLNLNSFVGKASSKFVLFFNEDIDLDTLIYIKKIKNFINTKISLFNINTIYKNRNLFLQPSMQLSDVVNNIDELSIFLGCNLKLEASILNARVKFKYKNTFLKNFVIGNTFDTNIPSTFVCLNIVTFLKIIEGRCIQISQNFFRSVTCFIFIGKAFADRIKTLNNIINFIKNFYPNIFISEISISSNSDGLRWLGINKFGSKKKRTGIFLGIKETNFLQSIAIFFKDCFLISSHKTFLNLLPGFILPAKTMFESDYKYLNIEHRPQSTKSSIINFLESRKYDTILKSLFNFPKKDSSLWYNHIIELINYPDIFSSIDSKKSLLVLLEKEISLKETLVFKYPIKDRIKNFYTTTLLSSHSKILKSCIKAKEKTFLNFF
uniref:NADH dehydrogenase subunit 11 n=1 Tax=Ochromonas danica TaxID=2986 RepID=Q9G927_OCHDN|nr:NADH dehydrogenase subunit 11 [Ochromonas danica]AAG18378.1 NADH dehydrogenase subunit 11 [Ochromonas danica]